MTPVLSQMREVRSRQSRHLHSLKMAAETVCVSDLLLGIPEDTSTGHRSSPLDSKIGGLPDFYPQSSVKDLPHCMECGSVMCLYAQLYCPLEGSLYHRTLYCFCCVDPQCSSHGCWRVLRSQAIDPHCEEGNVGDDHKLISTSQEPKIEEKATLKNVIQWCDGEDEWGGSEMEDSTTIAPDCIKGGSNCTTISTNCTTTISDCLITISDCSMNIVKCTTSTQDSSTKDQDTGGPLKPYTYQSDCAIQVSDCSTSPAHYLPKPEAGSVHTKAVDDVTLSGDMKKLTLATKEVTLATKEVTDVTNLVLPCFFINVVWPEDMEVENTSLSPSTAAVVRKFERKTSEFAGEESRSEEKYEKTLAKHGDIIFHKFYKKVSSCPSQAIRYQFGGKPLLIAAHPGDIYHCVPRCEHCGSVRVFEFQLMPSLVYFCERAASNFQFNSKLRLPEFGTVLIFTCSRSCWEGVGFAAVRKEFALVQLEKDSHVVSDHHS